MSNDLRASSELLRGAMNAKGWNIHETAAVARLSDSTVGSVLRQTTRLTPGTAAKLADALDEPRLLEAVVRARRRACEVCHQRFVSNHNSATRKRFCSSRCQERAWARKRYAGKGTERINGFLLRDMQKAVEQFCYRCSENACPDNGCELRPYSPLPFIALTRRKVA